MWFHWSSEMDRMQIITICIPNSFNVVKSLACTCLKTCETCQTLGGLALDSLKVTDT